MGNGEAGLDHVEDPLMQADIDVVPSYHEDHVRDDLARLDDRRSGFDPEGLGFAADGDAAGMQ